MTEPRFEAAQVLDVRPQRAQRLMAKVLEAFTLAYDLDDLETAETLLRAAEDIMAREGLHVVRQWGTASQRLVDAHFRLWERRYLD